MTILAIDTARNLHFNTSTGETLTLVSANAYSYEELTEAYNQTRVDYIVPMPMNAAKLREYVETYDVDMEASAVVIDGGQILALGMLGIREGRAWITRLGVVRSNRRKGVGWALVTYLVQQARQKNCNYIVIEVIDDNIPAHSLFTKKGFRPVRELLVLRRPPGPVNTQPPEAKIETLSYSDAVKLLKKRYSKPSWLDEYESMLNAGNLSGFYATLADGSQGWLVYQNTVFQLSRLVIQTEVGSQLSVGRALLHRLHTEHPVQDTKTENLPANDPHWSAFKELGYLMTFRRIEMILPLKQSP
jgi:ribosomal protein S18 acetylase RimI-like enzyme